MYPKALLKHFLDVIPEPRDVYEALQPLHVLCQFVGLAPYKTRVNEQNGSKSYEWSKWSVARCMLLLTLYAAGVGFQISLFDRVFGREIQEQLQHLQDYFLAIIVLVSVGFGCIYGGKVVEGFGKLHLIDGEFQGLAVWMPYRRTLILVILNITSIFLIGLVTIVWILIMKPPQTFTKTELLELVVFLPFLLLGYLMESQYIHYFRLIKYRYSILNEYLEALVYENKTRKGWVAEEEDEDSEDEKIPKYILKSIETIADSIVVVEKVANLHVKLSDVATLFNSSFAVQLLFRITIAFINIVTALYMIGVNFSNPSLDKLGSNVNIAFTAWAGSSALELLLVVSVTNATCEEANKCPQLMHKIRNATKNAKLQDVIEMYSLQMYHNRLEFYICGLFPLDFTLLHTIVAGVTTYLVILIQFNSAATTSTGAEKKALSDNN